MDISQVESESAISTWPLQLARLGAHFGIFRDVFHPDAYFNPVIPLEVKFEVDEETLIPVFFGNSIPAAEVQSWSGKYWWYYPGEISDE